MPSGQTHDRVTLWGLPVIAGLTYERTRSSGLTLIVAAGYLFGGLMFGPDLDIHSVQYKRWGWLRWIWIPYRGSLRHRSVLSHGPIIGTTLRILYLAIWIAIFGLLGLAIANHIGQNWTWEDVGIGARRSLRQHTYEWLALCIGLELGALSHYVSDWSLSTYKRFQKQGWKGLLPKTRTPKKRRTRRAKPTQTSKQGRSRSGATKPRKKHYSD